MNRRAFFKKLIGAAVAMTLPFSASAQVKACEWVERKVIFNKWFRVTLPVTIKYYESKRYIIPESYMLVGVRLERLDK